MRSLKLIETILSILITIILSLFVCIFLITRLLNVEPFIVLSGSMEPAVPTGSIVFADKNSKDINTGDIIAFHKGDISVTHRVSGIDEDGNFITKGDANETVDPAPVAREQVIGKCLYMIPFLGYAAGYMRTPAGIAVFVGMIAIYLVIAVYQKSKRRKTHEESKS